CRALEQPQPATLGSPRSWRMPSSDRCPAGGTCPGCACTSSAAELGPHPTAEKYQSLPQSGVFDPVSKRAPIEKQNSSAWCSTRFGLRMHRSKLRCQDCRELEQAHDKTMDEYIELIDRQSRLFRQGYCRAARDLDPVVYQMKAQ